MSSKPKKSTKQSKTSFDLEVDKIDLKLVSGGDSNNNANYPSSDNESVHSLGSDFHKPDKKKSKKSKDQKPTTSSKKRKIESDDEQDSDILVESDDNSSDESDYHKQSKSKAKKKSTKESKKSGTKKSKKSSDDTIPKPTKEKKVKAKDLESTVDPSSSVKSETHKHKLNYKGQTYYCKTLPPNFQEQLDGILEMRKSKNAPVDTIGAGKQFDKKETNKATKRFQILCALILSSQSSDEQVDIAMKNLLNHGLTVDNIHKTDYDFILHNMLAKLSMNKNKAKYLKEVAEILRNSHDSDVPRTKAEMKALPGVGNKVANLAMYYCWGENCGIAIDTHFSRIADRLGWTSKSDKKPDANKQCAEMEKWLPKVLWPDMNELLVGFGQQICSTKNPSCDQCLINKTCPWYSLNW